MAVMSLQGNTEQLTNLESEEDLYDEAAKDTEARLCFIDAGSTLGRVVRLSALQRVGNAREPLHGLVLSDSQGDA